MQLAVVAIASRRQWSDEEAGIRRDRDRSKGARFISQTSIMADAMRRSRRIDPLHRGACRHDRNPRLVVGRGCFERNLDRVNWDNSGRWATGEKQTRTEQKHRNQESMAE